MRLVVHPFGDNLDDDSFGYWGRICYDVTLL